MLINYAGTCESRFIYGPDACRATKVVVSLASSLTTRSPRPIERATSLRMSTSKPVGFGPVGADTSAAAERKSSTHLIPVQSFSAKVSDVRPTVIIIDIGGGEGTLFDHAPDLSHTRAIVAELHPHVIGSAGIANLFANLQRLGLTYAASLSCTNFACFMR